MVGEQDQGTTDDIGRVGTLPPSRQPQMYAVASFRVSGESIGNSRQNQIGFGGHPDRGAKRRYRRRGPPGQRDIGGSQAAAIHGW